MEDGERRRRPERSATVTNGRALGLFRAIAAVPVRHEPGTSEGDDPQPPPTAPRTRSPRLRRRACAARSGRAAAGGAAATGSPWPLCPLPCWDEGVTSAAGPGRGISPRGRPPPGVEVKRCRRPPPTSPPPFASGSGSFKLLWRSPEDSPPASPARAA